MYSNWGKKNDCLTKINDEGYNGMSEKKEGTDEGNHDQRNLDRRAENKIEYRLR